MPKNFDEYTDNYNSLVNNSIKFVGQSHDYYIRAKAPIISNYLANFSPRRMPDVLDIGCGIGLLHRHLPREINLHGIDNSELSIIEAGKYNSSFTYKFFDGKSIPYGDNTFDLVIMVCVLHHIQTINQQDILHEIFRVLKPGGALILIEHNPFNLATRYVFNNCVLDLDAELCYPRKVKTLLKSSGFFVNKLRYFLISPFSFNFLNFFERLFDRIPLGAQYYIIATKFKG